MSLHKKILTRNETKNLLKVSNSTLWNWEQSGILVPTRIGRRVYYLVESIEKFFEKTQ